MVVFVCLILSFKEAEGRTCLPTTNVFFLLGLLVGYVDH